MNEIKENIKCTLRDDKWFTSGTFVTKVYNAMLLLLLLFYVTVTKDQEENLI